MQVEWVLLKGWWKIENSCRINTKYQLQISITKIMKNYTRLTPSLDFRINNSNLISSSGKLLKLLVTQQTLVYPRTRCPSVVKVHKDLFQPRHQLHKCLTNLKMLCKWGNQLSKLDKQLFQMFLNKLYHPIKIEFRVSIKNPKQYIKIRLPHPISKECKVTYQSSNHLRWIHLRSHNVLLELHLWQIIIKSNSS